MKYFFSDENEAEQAVSFTYEDAIKARLEESEASSGHDRRRY